MSKRGGGGVESRQGERKQTWWRMRWSSAKCPGQDRQSARRWARQQPAAFTMIGCNRLDVGAGQPKCESCRFWVRHRDGQQDLGSCHRRAPRSRDSTPSELIHGTRVAVWVSTQRTDWCGEHEPVEPGG